MRAGASSAIAAIACKELGNGTWDDLVPSLVEGLKHEIVAYKLSSIMTVGKICEDVRPEFIHEKEADNLFTTLINQFDLATDMKLKAHALEAMLVMIPFAAHKLSDNEQFSMTLSRTIYRVIHAGPNAQGEPGFEILERGWKCMTELAHSFYLSFYDKVADVLESAFKLIDISAQGSSDSELEYFDRCGILAMETVSTLVQEEYEQIRRKKPPVNIILDIAEPLAVELMKSLVRFNRFAFA